MVQECAGTRSQPLQQLLSVVWSDGGWCSLRTKKSRQIKELVLTSHLWQHPQNNCKAICYLCLSLCSVLWANEHIDETAVKMMYRYVSNELLTKKENTIISWIKKQPNNWVTPKCAHSFLMFMCSKLHLLKQQVIKWTMRISYRWNAGLKWA